MHRITKGARFTILIGILGFVAGIALAEIPFSHSSNPSLPITKTKPIEKCAGEKATNFECYRKYYTAVVDHSGPKEAFIDLKHGYTSSSYIVSQCHQLTHTIGNEALIKYGSVAKAFPYGDPFCWSGYYHGVVEKAVARDGEDVVAQSLNTYCAEIPGKGRYSFDYYNCVHGLGHGLMAMTINQVFDSLKLCDTLIGQWERSSCYGGVFMENVMTDYRGSHTDFLKTDDLLYPCTGVAEQYKEQCYLMQTSYVLKKNGYDFRDVFKRCASVPAPHNETCGQSAGRDASGSTISNAIETKVRCDLAPTPLLFHNCMIGAVKDFVSYFHSDKEARGFCDMLSPKEKLSCENTVTSYYRTFSRG